MTKIKDRVVHTSLANFTSESNIFSERDTLGPTIGVVVKVGYQYRLKKILADICCYAPVILSPGKGEYIELEEADGKTRESLLTLSQYCRDLAEELTLHAERLEEIACNEEILDDLSKMIELRDSGVDPDQLGTNLITLQSRESESKAARSYITEEREFVIADTHREPRKRKPQERVDKPAKSSKTDIDIDALLDDED